MPKNRQLKRQSERSPSGQRIKLHTAAPEDSNSHPPHFSFRYMSAGYTVVDCEDSEKASFVDALWRRSQLSWVDLMNSRHQGLGSEKIPRQALRKPIPSGITDDVTFLAFRVRDLVRMIGFRDQATFHVVWLDTDGSVYDHGS